MAILSRVHGDSRGVVNVDSGKIVSTGIGKHPTAFKVVLTGIGAGTGVDGQVETAIRALCIGGTVIAYQADADQLSVLMESHGFASDAAATAAVVAAGLTGAVVTSTGGMMFA
jgi:hypothetical protein